MITLAVCAKVAHSPVICFHTVFRPVIAVDTGVNRIKGIAVDFENYDIVRRRIASGRNPDNGRRIFVRVVSVSCDPGRKKGFVAGHRSGNAVTPIANCSVAVLSFIGCKNLLERNACVDVCQRHSGTGRSTCDSGNGSIFAPKSGVPFGVVVVLCDSVGNTRVFDCEKCYTAVKAHAGFFFVGKIGNGGNVFVVVLFNAVKFRFDNDDSVIGDADNGDTVVCGSLRFFFCAGFPAEIVSAGKGFSY